MFFEWTDKLDVHVDNMNAEHKQIIALMNKMHDEVEKQSPLEEVMKTVADLEAVAKQHFADEEAYLESIHYPGTKQHKEIHTKLLERYAVQKEEFLKSNGQSASQFFSFLKIWLSSHIMGIDSHYGEFSQAKQKTA